MFFVILLGTVLLIDYQPINRVCLGGNIIHFCVQSFAIAVNIYGSSRWCKWRLDVL